MDTVLSAIGFILAAGVAYVGVRWVLAYLAVPVAVSCGLSDFETLPVGQSVWYDGRWWRELSADERPQDEYELMMTPNGRCWRPSREGDWV